MHCNMVQPVNGSLHHYGADQYYITGYSDVKEVTPPTMIAQYELLNSFSDSTSSEERKKRKEKAI